MEFEEQVKPSDRPEQERLHNYRRNAFNATNFPRSLV